jgi:lipopolysaccharide transport system ATP-binding protein
VAKGGRTVLFVSHNMNAVQRLCTSSMMLERGQLVAYGSTPEVLTRYLSSSAGAITPASWIDLSVMGRRGTGRARFTSIWYGSDNEVLEFQPYTDGPLDVALVIESDEARDVNSIAVTLYDEYGTKLVNADTIVLGQQMHLERGRNLVKLRITELHLNPGIYVLGLWVADPPAEIYDFTESAIRIEVVRLEKEGFGLRPTSDGSVVCDFEVREITPTNI